MKPDHPCARRLPESTLAKGYEIVEGGRRIDRAVEEAEKRERMVEAVLAAVGIKPETKEPQQ